MLDPAYTSDGGHLGPEGQRVLGSAFADFLRSLPKRPR